MHITIRKKGRIDLCAKRLFDHTWILKNNTTGAHVATAIRRSDGMWIGEVSGLVADEAFNFVTTLADNPKTALETVVGENVALIADVLQQLFTIRENFDFSDEDYTVSEVECERVCIADIAA